MLNTYLNLVNANLVLGIKKLSLEFDSTNNLDLAKISDITIILDLVSFIQKFTWDFTIATLLSLHTLSIVVFL